MAEEDTGEEVAHDHVDRCFSQTVQGDRRPAAVLRQTDALMVELISP